MGYHEEVCELRPESYIDPKITGALLAEGIVPRHAVKLVPLYLNALGYSGYASPENFRMWRLRHRIRRLESRYGIHVSATDPQGCRAYSRLWSIFGPELRFVLKCDGWGYPRRDVVLVDRVVRHGRKTWKRLWKEDRTGAELLIDMSIDRMGSPADRPLSPTKGNVIQAKLEKSRRDSHLRSIDRLCRANPRRSVERNREAYETGKNIARITWFVVAYLVSLLDKGKSLVIHGRDGEIFYELLKTYRDWPKWKNRVAYVISSRPLTNEWPSVDKRPEKLWRYLRTSQRVGPAIHIDTGYAGSIPTWMMKNGWEVEGIQMVSATKEDYQIPGVEAIAGKYLRDSVVDDMEHSPQRLAKISDPVSEDGELKPFLWGDPEGFWAKFQGILDNKPDDI